MLVQILLAVLTLGATALSQLRTDARRYACFLGLAAQPFWFYSAWQASQWGVLVTSVFFTMIWISSFWYNWVYHENT